MPIDRANWLGSFCAIAGTAITDKHAAGSAAILRHENNIDVYERCPENERGGRKMLCSFGGVRTNEPCRWGMTNDHGFRYLAPGLAVPLAALYFTLAARLLWPRVNVGDAPHIFLF